MNPPSERVHAQTEAQREAVLSLDTTDPRDATDPGGEEDDVHFRGILHGIEDSRPDLGPLLRKRLMLLTELAMGACGVASAIAVLGLSGPLRDVALPLHLALNGSGLLLNFGFFLLLWRRSFPEGFLRLVDLLFFLLNALVFVALPPLAVGGDNVNADSAALLVLVRCIYIPDTPLRTVGVGVAIWLTFIVAFLATAGQGPPELAGGFPDPQVTWLGFLFGNFSIALHLTIGLVAVYSLHGLRMRAFEAEQAGSYQLLEKLGEGGMGEVYRARHALLQRPTAVKVIQADLVDSPTAMKRFEREVRAASELTDPNTIAIYDFGKTDGGRFYYAMEYLEGVDLQDLVDRFGPVEPSRAVFLLAQVLGSLGEAHRRGLLHRDIKPGNLFLTARGSHFDFVKVLDFGLVKPLHPPVPGTPDITAEDSVPGTPLYMAPERFSGDDEAGPASDLYSVGAVGYFLLTGHAVFEGKSAAQVLVDQAKMQPIPPRRLGVLLSGELEATILRSLEKVPQARFSTAEEFREALRQTPEWGAWHREHARHWWAEHVPGSSSLASQPITPD